MLIVPGLAENQMVTAMAVDFSVAFDSTSLVVNNGDDNVTSFSIDAFGGDFVGNFVFTEKEV